jgi:solute carrier family 35 protein F1/2
MSANTREISPSRRSTDGTTNINFSMPTEHYTVQPKGAAPTQSSFGESSESRHGAVELVDSSSNNESNNSPPANTVAAFEASRSGRFSFLRSRQFYIVLLISQALAVAITGTNTLSSLLAAEGTSIPAFQTLFNYILLSLIYTSYTLYKYGFKGWCKLIYKDGWRYFILAFCDVEGNYFTVLAYRYTTILSAQLINFWAIAVVVLISLIFLKVRYHIAQYAGILICCGGLGLLVASDHITGSNGGQAANAVKGDLFALLGASFYGFTNVFEEFLVSKRPLYEVLGQLSFWAIPINGVQAAIFDRAGFRTAAWNSKVGGYLTGYTLILTVFYSGAPIVFRMASAAFFNIGLLTGNFWGVVVGVKVFGLTIHWMYPIAFVLIMVGHFVYFGTEGVLGEARKPWLGENQEGGSDGIGTAKRRVDNPGVLV